MNKLSKILSKLTNGDNSLYGHALESVEEIHRELEDIKYALDQSSIVAITDTKGVITYVNDKFCEISKYGREELIGQTHRILNSGYHEKKVFKDMWGTIQQGQVWEGELMNKAKDGSNYWVKTTIVPFLNKQGSPYQYIAIRTDITEQKRAERNVYTLAHYDELTGLPNRRLFESSLSKEIANAKIENQNIAVMFINLNRFKLINDSFSYKVGDILLKEISIALLKIDKRNDQVFVSRFGSDYFSIIVKEYEYAHLLELIDNIQQIFSVPFMIYEQEFYISSRIGISIYSGNEMGSVDTIQHAQVAEYFAKKNNEPYMFYQAYMDEPIRRSLLIEKEILKALDEEAFQIYYQPKVDLKTGSIIGLEALIRWHHAELGFISPEEFIPIAEDTGSIIRVGHWVMENAIKQLKSWHDKGYNQLTMSVNLSVHQLQQRKLKAYIHEIIQKNQVPPKCIEFEITETVAIMNQIEMKQKFEELKNLGLSIAMDDFGTGYSSLNYLRSYDINTIKIDKSFIQSYDPSNEPQCLISAIISMSHALNLSVVAEGTETFEQIAYLISKDCDYAQGYYFSKPLPAEQIEKILNTCYLSKINMVS